MHVRWMMGIVIAQETNAGPGYNLGRLIGMGRPDIVPCPAQQNWKKEAHGAKASHRQSTVS